MYQEQIKELLERYIRGECTEEEIALLEKWYDRLALEKETVRILSTEEEQRLVEELLEKIAGASGSGNSGRAASGGEASGRGASGRGASGRMSIGPGASRGPENRRHNHRILRYAAVWAGMIMVSGGIWMQWNRRGQRSSPRKPFIYTEIATRYQQVRKVLLPDSSVVWLNSATHLSFPVDFAKHREVRLSGEAFFEVAPDVEHPFVVLAGNTSTHVFGTSFNISAYPEAGELRISLKSGKVGVEYENARQKVLIPGQLMVYNKGTGSGEILQQAPGEMDVWTAGRMVFYKTPLKEALAQIEARYGVHIIYDHALTDRTITARFDNTALEKVLQSLSFGWDLHFVRDGDTLHVR